MQVILYSVQCCYALHWTDNKRVKVITNYISCRSTTTAADAPLPTSRPTTTGLL